MVVMLPGFFKHANAIGYRQRYILSILALQLVAVLFEGIGISAVLPVLQFVEAGGEFEKLNQSGIHWKYLIELAEVLNVPLSLPALLISVFTLIVLRQIFIYIRDIYSAWIQLKIIRHVRNEAFDGFLRADLSYHDEVETGRLVNELTTELVNAAASISTGLKFIGHLLTSAVYGVIVFTLSSSLSVFALIVLIVISGILLYVMRGIRSLGYLVTEANQEMAAFLIERLNSMRLVRLSNIEEAERTALQSYTESQRVSLFAQRKSMSLLSVLIEPMVLAVALSLLYIAVSSLAIELASILLFSFILLRLAPIVKEAVIHRQSYVALVASVEAVTKRLGELEWAKESDGGAEVLTEIKREIRFQNVKFKYQSAEVNALDGLNLRLPAKNMTALVGPSGAGKSTIVDCLPRLRTIQSGDIFIDDSSIKKYSVKSLRQAMSFVPQVPQIFNVTAAEHIRYGSTDASDEEVRAAAILSQSDEFIVRMKSGYNTLLGEGGVHLSGGQRQRLDLARALVRNASVLVLDEPTSNLDPESEKRFLNALQKIRDKNSMTIVVIAHKLTTVKLADQVAVIENGRVTNVGTHDELLISNAWYKQAYGGDVNFAAPPSSQGPATLANN